ncbi:MAG: hypothetical protein KGN31_03825 [Betaproteobacteria bacterium]|nr:hypothetical protein [Betaproteobacteria bacterium]MDE2423325.1 hypothetical protein [Betaproteobacteria bacterium]
MKLGRQKLSLIALSLTLFVTHALAQESAGWFSGISALPYTTFLGSNGSQSLNGAFLPSSKPNLLGGEGAIPIGKRWNMLGRLGTVSSDRPWLYNGTGSVNSVMPYDQMGLGLSYDMGGHLLLQGNLDRYQFKYNKINGDNGLDLLTIGLKYRF